jgi:hypothetical protein
MNSPASTMTMSPCAGRRDRDFVRACRDAIVGRTSRARVAQRIGLRLAAAFGDRLGEVREQHA